MIKLEFPDLGEDEGVIKIPNEEMIRYSESFWKAYQHEIMDWCFYGGFDLEMSYSIDTFETIIKWKKREVNDVG